MTRLTTLLTCLWMSFCLGTAAQSARMDRATEDYVAANMIAIFYHEFGHAVIDLLDLPIFGQEEDAADVLSALLIHDSFDEESAERIALATAYGFIGSTDVEAANPADVAYWDVHGPDVQRYYTFVCLFYGAAPDRRRDFARQLKLPEARQETCVEEYDLADKSWGPVMRQLLQDGGGHTIRFLADRRADQYGKLIADVIGREVASMNRDLSLPETLLVRVEPCDTANAFYDPDTREIIMCTEFARAVAEAAPD